jgi:hypothetical protein
MEHFKQYSVMFNGLLDTVSNDIVSQYFPILFSCAEHSRLTAIPDKGV